MTGAVWVALTGWRGGSLASTWLWRTNGEDGRESGWHAGTKVGEEVRDTVGEGCDVTIG